MKPTTIFFSLFLISSVVFSQTKEIFTNPKFNDLTKGYKVLAILPFKASVKLRPKQMQSMTQEQIERLQKDEGMAVQSAMETYFLKHIDEMNISFQPLITTNAILSKNNIDESNIDKYTPSEIAALLSVDGVINGLLFT